MAIRRFSFFFGIILFLSFTSCMHLPADPLSYQREASRLSMEGKIDGFSFSAELELFPLGTDAEGREMSPDTRDLTLTYTAPLSLAGIKLIRRGEQIRLQCGAVNVETDDARFAGMLLPAMLFCIDCEMGEAAVVEHNGTTLNRISVTDDEGRYLLWLDADGFPCRIEAIVDARSITVDVLRFPDESGS